MEEFSKLMIPTDDRAFEIGGEVFHWVTPYWEDLAVIYDEDTVATQRALERLEAEAGGNSNGDMGPSMRENIERTQQRIALFLPADEKAKWKKLCGRKTDPIPLFMFGRLYTYLMEVATGRPTSPPSLSAGGGGNGEASSQAASPSRAGTRGK